MEHFFLQLALDRLLREEECARAAAANAHQARLRADRELRAAGSSPLTEAQRADPVLLDLRERALVLRQAFLSCARREEERLREAWIRARAEARRLAIVRERAERRSRAEAQRREAMELDEANRALFDLRRTAKGWMG